MKLHYNESPAAASLKQSLTAGLDRSWLQQSPAAKWIAQKLGGSLNVMPDERLASTVAGGALVLNAFARPGLLSMVGGLLGGALLSRGLTGHCPVYSALGKNQLDTAGADGAPSQFAQQQAESTMQARTLGPRDTTHVGFGTTPPADKKPLPEN